MAVSPNRIDGHAHFVPPFWGVALPAHGGDPSGWTLPSWDADSHRRFMADNGIAAQARSSGPPRETYSKRCACRCSAKSLVLL